MEFQIAGKGDSVSGDVLLDDESKGVFSGSSWQVCRRMIYVPRSAQKGFAVGFWPIPEAFWPDVNAPSLVCYYFNIPTMFSFNYYYLKYFCIMKFFNSRRVLLIQLSSLHAQIRNL